MSTQPQGLSRRDFMIAGVGGALAVAAASSVSPFGPAVVAAHADPQSALAALANLRFGMFNHFNLGTFTDEEWAAPGQAPTKFAPPSVDCGQWADAAKAAKMTFGVLTTKHHDGFSLWPTAYGSQNVANSGYQGDIVRQYIDAFRSRGLRVGLYFSIWDRTYPVQGYGGQVGDTTESIDPADMTLVLGQIRELLTNYGTIDVFITDGWAWQMGQQALQYQQVRGLVKTLQPEIVMVDHGALRQPWIGDAIYYEEPLGVTSPAGNTYASLQGQTINNGWFWHPSTPNESLMPKADILGHLSDLEAKYTTFLLNCPPNRAGRLDTNIVNRLAEVGAAWSPNAARPPLPTQPPKVEWPITPVAAYATGFHDGEPARNAIDGRAEDNWETCWSTWSSTNGAGALALPQSITVDLGGVWNNVSILEYLPKQFHRDNTNTNGDITSYTIAASVDGINFTQVASGSWSSGPTTKSAQWTARSAAFIRLTANAATGLYANVGGLKVGGSARTARQSNVVDTTKVYRIANRNSGKVLDVYNFGTANGTRVQQYTWTGVACQRFSFASTDDGYYTIKDQSSGKVIEIGGCSRQNDARANIWADMNAFQQHWAVTPIAGGYVVLTNRFSGKTLNVAGASSSDEAPVDQWEYTNAPQEQWQLVAL